MAADKINRSLKLCQLINDRKTDSEVGVEIRKLLIEGVDINIQDLNRNENTPLHLATQKSDKICLRILLKYKPNLQIRNGSGETPFDIAQSDEVKELLSSASFDVMEKKFIREIEFQHLSLERLKCLETDPAFKVLKITCCPNDHVIWGKLNQPDFKDAMNNLSHLFIIAIETKEDEIEDSLTMHVDIKRSIIVQITSDVSKKTKIYHKGEDSTGLIEIKINSTINEDFFNDVLHSEAFYDLDLLVQALNSNIFGSFNGSLLDVKLNNDKNRGEIVNCYAASNALCHRFFKLFDEKLTDEELSVRVNQTLKFPGDQSLLALLDLPFEFNDGVQLTDGQKRILNFVDYRNYNLIMLAIECNNSHAVRTLLRFPIDLGHLASDNRWASDLYWEKQHWERLAELIEAGSPYPDNFDPFSSSFVASAASGKIESSIEAVTAFHESIEQGDIEAVKLFIRNNPNLKHVYDSTNKSALTVALESDEAEVFSLLLSEGFTPGLDDKYEEAFENCNVKSAIRNKNREYFKNAFDEPHLKRLLNKYKLSLSSLNREACSQVIQNMFLTLNEIPEMVPILQIVSCSEKLKIVFDFDCPSVQQMDPTAGSSSTGLTYRISGFIYVGARNHCEEFFEVIGNLAHELTHYAMELTYKNNCKPYAIDNEANQEILESIVNDYHVHVQTDTSADPIISTVFSYYKQEVWHQELIVRVPHLLARYKNASETLEEVRHKNNRLFDFFLFKVLPNVKAQTKVLLHKLKVKKINSRTGTIEKIKKHELQLKKCEIKIKDQIFGSNAPQLTLCMLRQSLDESSHVFITIEQIAFGNIRESICKLQKKDFAIVVDCTEMVQKHEEAICNVKKTFKNSKVIFLVMKSEETSIVTSKLTNFEKTPIEHVWSDLNDESQEVLMGTNVNFQGTFCSLRDLTIESSDALLELPLNEFCNSENFKIGDPLVDPFHKFYLPRSFITREVKANKKGDQLRSDLEIISNAMHSDPRPQVEKRIFKSGLEKVEGFIDSEQFETIERTLDEILEESEEKTVVIISDSAGTGKTTTMFEIAKRLREKREIPKRWTCLTDLKKHIGMLKKTQREDFKSFQDFVTQIILADKSSFERGLFAQFYQEGRTSILLDGFDEISPLYKNEVLKALKLFTPKSGNQLWITTRSHLELDLEKTFDQLSCSLQPLTTEYQIEFLENIWKSDTISMTKNSQENFSNIAKDLVNKLSSISDSKSSFIGLPILISMVAAIYDNPEKRSSIEPEKLSFYSIFKQLVGKNIDIAIEKGEIAEAERKEISKQSEGIVEVHSKIAIAHFFGDEVDDVDVEYDDEQWTVEKLTRLGLIRYDESNKNLSFIHETFAEYFLADFIIGNLRTKTKACGAIKVLVKVLTEKDFQVVRLFLDQALKEINFIGDKKLCETVGKQLNAMREEILGILLHICKESGEETFKFMLNTIKHVGEQILLVGTNVLFINIGTNSRTMIKTLFDFIEQNTKLENTKHMIQAVSPNKSNVFHAAASNKHEEIFPTLHECANKFLTIDEIRKMLRERDIDGFSVLQIAADRCNENALNDLMKILKGYFSNEEMKEMMFEVNKHGNNGFHDASFGNNKIALKSFFEHVNETLNTEETKKLIQQRGVGQRNVFHSACSNQNEEIFQSLYECINKFLTIDEIRKMLREKDANGFSVLQGAAAEGNENALNGLLKILKGLFSNEEMKEMMFEVNKHGNNGFHDASFGSNKIALKSYFEHVNGILNPEETKKLILRRAVGQRNIFHVACYNKNEEIFPTLYECTNKFLEKHEIKRMLSEKCEYERSVLQCAAEVSSESALNDLMKILKGLFSNEENPEEYKKLLQQRGFNQKNIFHVACFNKNEEIFPTLYECTNKFLEEHEIKEMLREKDDHNSSILEGAAQFCKENALNDLMKILKGLFSNGEMKEMLLEVDNDGDNSLHTAVHENNKIALKSYFKHVNEILNPEENKKLIQQKDQKNVERER